MNLCATKTDTYIMKLKGGGNKGLEEFHFQTKCYKLCALSYINMENNEVVAEYF